VFLFWCTKQWDVDRYQAQHSFVWQYGASLIDIAKPMAGERILDVGCGTGELTAKLAAQCGVAGAAETQSSSTSLPSTATTIIGMDADASMIAKAQEQFPHLQFFQGDIRNFELSSETDSDSRVDLLFSNAVLHWVPERKIDDAVRSMARALKPGGRFVVEFGGKGNVGKIVRACQDVIRESKGLECPNPWYYPSISEFTSALEKHGIEVTSAELYDRPTLLDDGENGMSNWIRMFGSKFLEYQSTEDDIVQFLVDVNDKLRPYLFDATQWTADYRRIRIVGRKIGT
jgi:trans-aconitate methyltransferase